MPSLEIDALRRLTISSPKEARTHVLAIQRAGGPELEALLQAAGRPGEGRLRHLIATVFQREPTSEDVRNALTAWVAAESDEFTRTAIVGALSGGFEKGAANRAERRAPPDEVHTYRYVAERLAHRVRNAMTLPAMQLTLLEERMNLLDPAVKGNMAEQVALVRAGFASIAKTVGFDVGDDYTKWQDIAFIPWLTANEADFAGRFGSARLLIVADGVARKAVVRSSRFALDTIIANVWANAVQVAGPGAELTVQASPISRWISIVFIDAGPGFSEEVADSAFVHAFSTKGQSHGRGLLEIAEAVQRLQGEVSLVRDGNGAFRIRIDLPVSR